MTLLQLARLRLALTHGPLGLDAVQLADTATSISDCRIAVMAARGLPLHLLNPTTGQLTAQERP